MLYKVVIATLIATSLSCNAASPQKEAAAAKARQDASKPKPEWLKKKIVPITGQEHTDLKAAEDNLASLEKQQEEAAAHLSELKEQIIATHGLDKYPANIEGGVGGYIETIGVCAGTISLIDSDSQTYIMYTPGGFSCYVGGGGIYVGTGGATWNIDPNGHVLINEDVEDRR